MTDKHNIIATSSVYTCTCGGWQVSWEHFSSVAAATLFLAHVHQAIDREAADDAEATEIEQGTIASERANAVVQNIANHLHSLVDRWEKTK